MRINDVLNCDAEYARWAPIMEVAADAREAAYADMRSDEEGIIGEQIAEIGSERAFGGSLTPGSDAVRIWVFQRVSYAVARFGREAPRHREDCETFNLMLPI
jgi:hypothetical protein